MDEFEFDPMDGVSYTDVEDDLDGIKNEITIVSNNVDLTKPGTYEIVYEVIDSLGNVTTVARTITITNRPKITAPGDITVDYADDFDLLDGVSATDVEDGNITIIEVIGKDDVNWTKAGTYAITYKVTDSDGNITTHTRVITVRDVVRPTIEYPEDSVYKKGDDIDLEEGIKITDKDGNDITDTVTITSNVDKDKVGEYTVEYKVVDKYGNVTTFNRTIEVVRDTIWTFWVILATICFGFALIALSVTMLIRKKRNGAEMQEIA